MRCFRNFISFLSFFFNNPEVKVFTAQEKDGTRGPAHLIGQNERHFERMRCGAGRLLGLKWTWYMAGTTAIALLPHKSKSRSECVSGQGGTH